MAVRRSYQLISAYTVTGVPYGSPAVELAPEDDCFNIFVTTGSYVGLPGDGLFVSLQTSPDGTYWTSILEGGSISGDTNVVQYVTPSDLYIKPDRYIRAYLTMIGGPYIWENINVYARVGTFSRRGRYGH